MLITKGIGESSLLTVLGVGFCSLPQPSSSAVAFDDFLDLVPGRATLHRMSTAVAYDAFSSHYALDCGREGYDICLQFFVDCLSLNCSKDSLNL